MSTRAKVGSLEAIEAFRSTLVVYVAQARSALEEISGDVLRTRVWLENDQRRHWEGEMRRRRVALEEAQQELFSARLSTFSTALTLQQMAVQRARRALEESDSKLRVVKRWDRDFEGTVQPLVKQMEKLHTMLANDLIKALAELNNIIKSITSYVQTAPPGFAAETAPASGGSDGPGTNTSSPPGNKSS
jgi:hypothetical protein